MCLRVCLNVLLFIDRSSVRKVRIYSLGVERVKGAVRERHSLFAETDYGHLMEIFDQIQSWFLYITIYTGLLCKELEVPYGLFALIKTAKTMIR